MDRVLGVSMTSAAVRMVLVDGTSGEGATLDRDAFDIVAFQGAITGDGNAAFTPADGDPPHAVGVTWTTAAESAASDFLGSLAARGLDNVIAVSTSEAAAALTAGIADVAGYTNLAVCVVEPDEAVVAMLGPDGPTVDGVDRTPDAAELAGRLIARVGADVAQPEAVFVVGSADDLDAVVSALEGVTTSPVISAADAGLALARGAALASARAVNTLDLQAAPVRRRMPSKTATLTSVLVAAVVTFVVSLSVALGLRLVPGTDAESRPREVAKVADQPARAPSPPAAVPAVPPPAAPPPPPPPEAPPADPVPEVAPVSEPEPPVYVPPPVYQPDPAPAYVPPPVPEYVPPPPPPVYVPPPAPNYVPPPPQPRLRDRIIERIPIINRFHEPEYPTN